MKQQVVLLLALGVAACHAGILPEIELQGKIQVNSSNPNNALTQAAEKIVPTIAKGGSSITEKISQKGSTVTSKVKQPFQVLSLWEAIKNAIECIVKSFSTKFSSLLH